MGVRTRDWRDAYALAHAAGRDAGLRSAARAGRAQWDDDDWNRARETFTDMMSACGYDADIPREDYDTGRVRLRPPA